jgi:hypothetical protein
VSVHEHENPDMDELAQQDPPVQAVPVRVEGPVQTRAMPAVLGIHYSRTFGTTAEQLVGRELRRSRLLVWCKTNPIWVGRSQAEVDADTCAQLPAGLILPIQHTDEVWVAAETATALVSYVHELWAD